MVYLPPFSAVLWITCLSSLQFCGLLSSVFLQLCDLLASRLCSFLVVWPPTSTVLWFIGLQSLQNQQTRQIISAGKTSHKHNNKDLIRPYGNLTWHASKYEVLKLHPLSAALLFTGMHSVRFRLFVSSFYSSVVY